MGSKETRLYYTWVHFVCCGTDVRFVVYYPKKNPIHRNLPWSQHWRLSDRLVLMENSRATTLLPLRR